MEGLLLNICSVQRMYSAEVRRATTFEAIMAIMRPFRTVWSLGTTFAVLGVAAAIKQHSARLPHDTKEWFGRWLITVGEWIGPLLIIGGIISFVTTETRYRREFERTELDKMRDVIRGKFRQIISDAQRGWKEILEQHLNNQIQYVVLTLDPVLQEHATKRASEIARERQRIQLQLQQVETTERKLLAASKAREGISNVIAQAEGELRQLIITAIQQEGR
jgi:ElaB/YqjD/DUF883 family membrane-anchored ribosome-binding protein